MARYSSAAHGNFNLAAKNKNKKQPSNTKKVTEIPENLLKY